jgi:hypothetical protein
MEYTEKQMANIMANVDHHSHSRHSRVREAAREARMIIANTKSRAIIDSAYDKLESAWVRANNC